MICKSCICGCYVLPPRCLEDADSRIKANKMYDKPEILNAVNTFVLIGVNGEEGGILGQDCFDELCSDIKQAEAQAAAYREANPERTSDDEMASFYFYMQEKWRRLIQSQYFINMYAAYVVYWYYRQGHADAETTRDGDINHQRGSSQNDNDGSRNISRSDADKRKLNQSTMADAYKSAFIFNYMDKYRSDYGCLPQKEKVCAKNCNCKDCSTGHIKPKRSSRPRPTFL
jgi:hypothetical protein